MDLKEKTLALRPQTNLLLKGDLHLIKPNDAWNEGTNIQKAVKVMPDLCRGWIYSQVAQLCKDMNCTKTLSTDEELQFTCRAILQEHPTLKLEELKVCFDMIRMGKFGKLFERLKSAEILEFLRRYEGEVRAEVLEQNHQKSQQEESERMADKIEPLTLKQFISDKKVKLRPEGIGTRLAKKNGWDKEL
jgi:hypothetical protein